MPAVCLLTWALKNLPKTPELARKRAAVYRIAPWLFPSPQNYDPKFHFHEGTVMTTNEFRAASRSLAITANPNFSRPLWVGEERKNKGHYLLMEVLLPGVSLSDILSSAIADPARRKGRLLYSIRVRVRRTLRRCPWWPGGFGNLFTTVFQNFCRVIFDKPGHWPGHSSLPDDQLLHPLCN